MNKGIFSQESINLILESLKQYGFECHLKKDGETGGIYYQENGTTQKFDENIFIKRSIKYDETESDDKLVPIDEISGEENECEPNISSDNSFKLDIVDFDCAISDCNHKIQNIHLIGITNVSQSFDYMISSVIDAA